MKKAKIKSNSNNKKRNAIIIACVAAIVVIATLITVIVILKNKKDENPHGLSDELLSAVEAHAKIPGHGFIIGDNKWQTDPDYHWYICQHKTCEDKLNYGAHEWNEGVVLSDPTKYGDGETRYTCTVCGRKKTVKVPYEAPAEQAPEQRPDPNESVDVIPNWLEVIKESDFENFSFSQSVSFPYGDTEITRSENTTLNFTKDLAKATYTYQHDDGECGNLKDFEEFDGSKLTLKRREVTDVVLLLLNDKNKFEYDTESQLWKAKETFKTTVTLAGIDSETELTNLRVKFTDTYVSDILFDFVDGEQTKSVHWSFYHYNDTSFDFPEDPYEGLE